MVVSALLALGCLKTGVSRPPRLGLTGMGQVAAGLLDHSLFPSIWRRQPIIVLRQVSDRRLAYRTAAMRRNADDHTRLKFAFKAFPPACRPSR